MWHKYGILLAYLTVSLTSPVNSEKLGTVSLVVPTMPGIVPGKTVDTPQMFLKRVKNMCLLQSSVMVGDATALNRIMTSFLNRRAGER